jgi:hypothetical protein
MQVVVNNPPDLFDPVQRAGMDAMLNGEQYE